MLKKFKDRLLSVNGMTTINLLFAFAAFIGTPVLFNFVFAIWLFYLYHSFKATKYKFMKIFYGILSLFAATYIILTLYRFITIDLCFPGSRCPNL